MSSNDFSASQEVIEPANSIPLSQQSGLEISSRNNFKNEPEIHYVSVSNRNLDDRDLHNTG